MEFGNNVAISVSATRLVVADVHDSWSLWHVFVGVAILRVTHP